MLAQMMIWTYTGVPRKNQMYPHATHESTGLSESRMTARTTPPAAPTAMHTKVSSMVRARPSRVSGLNRYSCTVGQSMLGLVTNE